MDFVAARVFEIKAASQPILFLQLARNQNAARFDFSIDSVNITDSQPKMRAPGASPDRDLLIKNKMHLDGVAPHDRIVGEIFSFPRFPLP